MDRTNPRYSKEVAAAESNVSRRAKGVLASKTNSYPRSPLSAVFFADNLLLAAWFTAPLRGSEKERNKKRRNGAKEKNYFWEALIFIVLHTYVATGIILRWDLQLRPLSLHGALRHISQSKIKTPPFCHSKLDGPSRRCVKVKNRSSRYVSAKGKWG